MLDRKMEDTFYDGHDELYHHAKFGKDRTTRAGCRCENVVFVFFLFVGHAPSPLLTYLTCVGRVHSSNKHCVAVYCPISMRFTAFFSQVIRLSEALHISHICH